MDTQTALEKLRHQFPWPAERPKLTPVKWSLDYGGRELVTELISKRNFSVILEIGAFLGGSATTWLNASPDVIVIAVDPWAEPSTAAGSSFVDLAIDLGRPDLADQLRQVHEHQDGFYQLFLSNMWDFHDRLIPVRGFSPDVLEAIQKAGVQPDLIYLDADKSGDEIDVLHGFFPNAMITGDDWEWGALRGFPIRRAVKRFCKSNGKHLHVCRQTWVIDDKPSTPQDRPNSIGRLLNDALLIWLDGRHRLRKRLVWGKSNKN